MVDITTRRATMEDYDAIMAINRNIFNGFDYLPHSYYIMIREQRNNFYVAELDGEIVGFRNCMVINNGTVFLSTSGRVRKDLQGKGIMKKMFDLSDTDIKQRYPSVTKIVWTSLWNNLYASNIRIFNGSPFRVLNAWQMLVYIVSKEDIAQSSLLKVYGNVDLFENLDASTAVSVLRNTNNKELFTEVPLVAYQSWVPIFFNDEDQLKDFCLQSHVLAKDLNSNFEVSSLSHSSPQRTPIGLTANVFCSLRVFSKQLLLGHFAAQLAHIHSIANDDFKVGLVLHMPADINIQDIENTLRSDFGEPLSSNNFGFKKVGFFEINISDQLHSKM